MLMQASDDKIIDMLNDGRVMFSSISQSDQAISSSKQLYIHITLRTGDQYVTRDLYLKGKVLDTEYQGPDCQTISPLKRHHCITCNKGFPLNNSFLSHIKSCHEKGLYKCIYCDESFLAQGYFKSHMNCKHKNPDLTYTSFTTNDKEIKQMGQSAENTKTLQVNELSTNDPLEEHSEVLVNSSEKLTHGNIQIDKTKLHIKETLHQCSYCNKEFGYISLITHIRNHDGDGLIPCNLCDKRFHFANLYQKHRIDDHKLYEENRPYQCSICDETFIQRKPCQDHLKDVHNIEIPKNKHTRETTSQCNQSLNNEDLNNHPLSGHSTIQNLDSENQGPEFQAISHSKLNRHHCITCNKVFASYGSFLAHTENCHDMGFYTCIYCDASFITLGLFKIHMRAKHKNPDHTYTSFTTNDNKIKQKVQSEGNTNTVLVNKLNTNYPLKEHSEALVSSAEKITNRIRLYIKDTLHQCSYCNKEYNCRNFKKHIKKQHGNVLIPCNHCDKRFPFIEPYQCSICDKTFIQIQQCKRHIKYSHNIEDHKNNHTNNTTSQCNHSLETQELNNHPLSVHSMIQNHEKFKSIDSVGPGNLCEPKIEVTEDEDIWFTEPTIKIKEEMETEPTIKIKEEMDF